MTILGHLKTLTHLDGLIVTEEEAAEAVHMVASSKINQVKTFHLKETLPVFFRISNLFLLSLQKSLLAHSRTSSSRPHCLSLLSTAQLLCLLSPPPWGLVQDLELDWAAKVRNNNAIFLLKSSKCLDCIEIQTDLVWICFGQITTLNLDSQGIYKLTNLNSLVNLRWASFNDNDISKVEGLDSCLNLEELSLDNNNISTLGGESGCQLDSETVRTEYLHSVSAGLSKLQCLNKLSLNGNHLSSLDYSVLDQMPQLCFLSVENNCVTSLHGIQRARSLQELYVSNNHISMSKDIYCLKVRKSCCTRSFVFYFFFFMLPVLAGTGWPHHSGPFGESCGESRKLSDLRVVSPTCTQSPGWHRSGQHGHF